MMTQTETGPSWWFPPLSKHQRRDYIYDGAVGLLQVKLVVLQRDPAEIPTGSYRKEVVRLGGVVCF